MQRSAIDRHRGPLAVPELHALIDEIAGVILTADPDDPRALAGSQDAVAELAALAAKHGEEAGAKAYECLELVRRLTDGQVTDAQQTLDAISEALAALQQALRAGKAKKPRSRQRGHSVQFDQAAAVPTHSMALELPPEVDDEIFGEFLGNLKVGLPELNSLALDMRQGLPETTAELRRRLHTLKGEAGLLGLHDLSAVCHGIESVLEMGLPSPEKGDRVLRALDWVEGALQRYARRFLPEESGASLVERLLAEHSSEPASTVSASPPTPSTATPTLSPDADPAETLLGNNAPEEVLAPEVREPVPLVSEASPPDPRAEPIAASPSSTPPPSEREAVQSKVWEESDLDLVGEFLDETDEGLLAVDQVLLEIEQSGSDAERVNRLFRVFHTIKGVAGCLELAQITSLAHDTETMLDRVRTGVLDARGTVLDLVFDATTAMRAMLSDLRAAVQESRGLSNLPIVEAVLLRIRAVNAGLLPPAAETPLPSARPGQPIGEILVEAGLASAEEIEEALAAQPQSARKLGEELVAREAVPAKAVAHALRAQNQARGREATKIREVVKVDLGRVDSLVETIGELVIVESMVSHAPEIRDLPSHLRNYLGQFAKITRELQEIGMRMRMVPVRGEFQKMTRLVRDLGRKAGKEVQVEVRGEGTEMDRSMVEQLADPLVHLIRNSVDHGLEAPSERTSKGKPPTGTILLSAAHEGGSIVVEVRDDGRGINREAVLEKAVSKGLVKSGAKLSDAEVFDLIFAPGFSTAKQVTEISGRGVGMDVVKRNIDAMRGRIITESVPGKGTTFRLVLPLTLAIIDGMVIRCGEESFILPTRSIIESLQPTQDMLATLAGDRELIVVRGEALPMLRMARLLDIPDGENDPTRALVVILETLTGSIGLVVDEVLTQQQVVIKSVGSGFIRSNMFSGAAILSNGRVGLIINIEELVAIAGMGGRSTTHHRRMDEPPGRGIAEA